MKHKHYEMIVAKAANMELVLFVNTEEQKWRVSNCGSHFPSFYRDPEYQWFLCLPQHKEACLHWLNGGEIQDYYNGEWTKIKCHDGNPDWNEPDQLFMNEEFQLRIKPKKEKRWIAVYQGMAAGPFSSKGDAKNELSFIGMSFDDLNFIEIEIEV